ncbi:TPA: CDP-glycerol glycerophosphotransferase family protein [Campylobacter jejuni]|nr:CDP-glycerol glycerophosphotransferase family protein [Campylobacter jejuni]
MLKFSSENKKFIKVVLDGIFRIYLVKFFSKFQPKKYRAFSKYSIVCAVYNVEKYLDDFFKSIINQRLDFKNNIFIICVDDGSVDNSAQIIKKYQKKYPKNIIYLYKENDGQASARNLGLKYLKENDLNVSWVTFTDPDDFLDRNYFYEVDKFLSNNKNKMVSIVATNVMIYNHQNKFVSSHPLSFKFNIDKQIKYFNLLTNEMQSSTTAFFILDKIKKKNICFNESLALRSNFEDGLFCYEYMLKNFKDAIVYLKKPLYFYRKNIISTTSKTQLNKDYYLSIGKFILNLFLEFEKKFGNTIYIQNIALYFYFWQIKNLINNSEKISFMNDIEKKNYLQLLYVIFKNITIDTIMNFNLFGSWFFYKAGFLNCFKQENPRFNILYLDNKIDNKDQIMLCYYSGSSTDILRIEIDYEQIYPNFYKKIKYDFIGKNFVYQHRLWVNINQKLKGKLRIYLNGVITYISFNGRMFLELDISNFKQILNKDIIYNNPWIFIDRDIEADDNAECLYRYFMKHHNELFVSKRLFFALNRNSIDWERLKNEGFHLLDFNSYSFRKIARKASVLISSHADNYILKHFNKNVYFVFLQHGVIRDDLSHWLNSKPINIFITSTEKEFYSIVSNDSRYKFTKKEVILTGLPRHDRLSLANSQPSKYLLIMPTWRRCLVDSIHSNSAQKKCNYQITESQFFIRWSSLLQSQELKYIAEKYGYEIIFCPHINMRPILHLMNVPDYIHVYTRSNHRSLSELFINSFLMITDYSSVAFEMAFLHKPVIYYQFDFNDYFSLDNHTSQLGYFNFKRDGFGPVVQTESELIAELNNIIQFGFSNENYYLNIKNAFKFRDGKSCERIYNEIVKTFDSNFDLNYDCKYILKRARNAIINRNHQQSFDDYMFAFKHEFNLNEFDLINCLKLFFILDSDIILKEVNSKINKKLSSKFFIEYIDIMLLKNKCDKIEEMLLKLNHIDGELIFLYYQIKKCILNNDIVGLKNIYNNKLSENYILANKILKYIFRKVKEW